MGRRKNRKKPTPQFKIGDIVQIKPDTKQGASDNRRYFIRVSQMNYIGELARVVGIEGLSYYLNIDSVRYLWHEECLILIESKEDK